LTPLDPPNGPRKRIEGRLPRLCRGAGESVAWGWDKVDHQTWIDIRDKLSDKERTSWAAIEGAGSHNVELPKLSVRPESALKQ